MTSRASLAGQAPAPLAPSANASAEPREALGGEVPEASERPAPGPEELSGTLPTACESTDERPVHAYSTRDQSNHSAHLHGPVWPAVWNWAETDPKNRLPLPRFDSPRGGSTSGVRMHLEVGDHAIGHPRGTCALFSRTERKAEL
jgi:hypothetical protein